MNGFFAVVVLLLVILVVGLYELGIKAQKRELAAMRRFVGEINRALLQLTVTVRKYNQEALCDLDKRITEIEKQLQEFSYSTKATKIARKEFEDMSASMERFYDLITADVDRLFDRTNAVENAITNRSIGNVRPFPRRPGAGNQVIRKRYGRKPGIRGG
jgi:hypothetical protein